jgi:inner membrane protein
MDPFTHLLTGACLARAGFNRKAAYATAAMIVAADLPDIDVLWAIRGPVAAFQHHRGWTHTFLGVPLEAAAVVGGAWLWHRWRSRTTRPPDNWKPSAAPVRWTWLYVCALVALLSHLALDWTNNYGLRPFFPFNPRWYAGSFVFIFEPAMFALLLMAFIAPALFGLIGSEVGARREHFRGRGWAIAALIGIAALWGWRVVEQQKALQLATTEGVGGAEVLRVWPNAFPITPFKWHLVVETPQYYQTADVDTLKGTVTTGPEDILYKQPATAATTIAKNTWLGEVYLDWSQLPLVEQAARGTDPEDSALTTVTFRDLRFMYDVAFLRGRNNAPLAGSVTLDANHRIVEMKMDGHIQK